MSDSELILMQVKVPRDLVKKVDHIAIELGKPRAGAVEHLLMQGLEHTPHIPDWGPRKRA